MRITQYSVGGHILIELTPATAGDIIPIAHFGASAAAMAAKADPNLRGLSVRVESLRAIATIVSIPAVSLPNFELLDSDSERLAKALSVQWTSPRKQLGIYHSLDGTNWIKVGAQSLINSSGYPYSTHDLLNFLGNGPRDYPDGSHLGVKLEDAGTGLLGPGDKLIIDGSFFETFLLGEGVSSVGQISVPDLATVEGAIQTLNNAIANQGASLDAIVASIGDIDTPGDISAQLQEILERIELQDMPRRSNYSTESSQTVGTTNSQLIAADPPLSENPRMSVIIAHAGESGSVFVRTGAEAATTTLWVAKLEPGDLIELATGEAIQAIGSQAGIPVNVTEVS